MMASSTTMNFAETEIFITNNEYVDDQSKNGVVSSEECFRNLR